LEEAPYFGPVIDCSRYAAALVAIKLRAGTGSGVARFNLEWFSRHGSGEVAACVESFALRAAVAFGSETETVVIRPNRGPQFRLTAAMVIAGSFVNYWGAVSFTNRSGLTPYAAAGPRVLGASGAVANNAAVVVYPNFPWAGPINVALYLGAAVAGYSVAMEVLDPTTGGWQVQDTEQANGQIWLRAVMNAQLGAWRLAITNVTGAEQGYTITAGAWVP
jgi:hypothetical protein